MLTNDALGAAVGDLPFDQTVKQLPCRVPAARCGGHMEHSAVREGVRRIVQMRKLGPFLTVALMLLLEGCIIATQRNSARPVESFPGAQVQRLTHPLIMGIETDFVVVGITPDDSVPGLSSPLEGNSSSAYRKRTLERIRSRLEEDLKRYGFHSRIGSEIPDYWLIVRARMNARPRVFLNVLNVATGFVFPYWTTHRYEVAVDLVRSARVPNQPGQPIGSHRVDMELSVYSHWFCIFAAPFTRDPITMEARMWEETLADIAFWASEQVHQQEH